MQVLVNCKQYPIDYKKDYRAIFRNRADSPKSFLAEMTQDPQTGHIKIVNLDNQKPFTFTENNLVAMSFFLDDRHMYTELVVSRTPSNKQFAFVLRPVDENLELGQDTVVSFREGLDTLAESAHLTVSEYIDPNPLNLVPSGINDMEELVALRTAEKNMAIQDEVDPVPADEAVEDEPVSYERVGDVADDDTFDIEEPSMDAIGVVDEAEDDETDPQLMTLDELTDIAEDINAEDINWDGVHGDVEGAETIEETEDVAEDETPAEDTIEAEGAAEDTAEPPLVDAFNQIQTETFDTINETMGTIQDLQERLTRERDRYQREFDELIESESTDEDLTPMEVKDYTESPDRLSAFMLDAFSSKPKSGESSEADYEEALENAHQRKDELIESVGSGDRGGIAAGLIAMLEDQLATNDDLAADFRKSKIQIEHYVEQLEVANAKLAEQGKELDENRRRLRISQENQRKAEKFVQDAREGVQKVVSAADAKLDEAISKVENMNLRMNNAEKHAANAIKARNEMEQERDNALSLRDEALRNLNKEKQRVDAIAAEYETQLSDFQTDILAKVKKQMERAEKAEKANAVAAQRITELEDQLVEQHTKLMEADSSLMEKTTALSELQRQYSERIDSSSDLQMRYEESERALDKANATIDKAQNDLIRAQQTADRLRGELSKAVEQRNDAVAKASTAVEDAHKAYDGAIDAATASQQQADEAAQNIIDAFSKVMSMPSGFGSRKAKIDAFESAYNSFVSNVEKTRSNFIQAAGQAEAIRAEHEGEFAEPEMMEIAEEPVEEELNSEESGENADQTFADITEQVREYVEGEEDAVEDIEDGEIVEGAAEDAEVEDNTVEYPAPIASTPAVPAMPVMATPSAPAVPTVQVDEM